VTVLFLLIGDYFFLACLPKAGFASLAGLPAAGRFSRSRRCDSGACLDAVRTI